MGHLELGTKIIKMMLPSIGHQRHTGDAAQIRLNIVYIRRF